MDKFYSLDDILATEEHLPCIMKREAPGLGKLDPTRSSPDLQENARIEVPFYIAHDFVRRAWADIELPRFYGPKYMGKLEAGPETVPLSEWCPYYYELGLHLVGLLRYKNFAPTPDVEKRLMDLVPKIKKAFVDRFQTIVLTDHSLTEDMAEVMRYLAAIEQTLVFAKQDALHDYVEWRKRRSDTIGGADGRKRRR
eukprot:comp23206_c0_seq1/m.37705 comp23206_c0_seq1/g.37705  ORF comp23206_c0_seq1/g.37705 comp23206_c0_seq1/m.37705 type:complete len:196 (-) comp23206_c0_seq1:605-1192(-)